MFVLADVVNRGDARGSIDTTLKVDGAVESTHRVTLAPGERTTVRFRLSLSSTGTHGVSVNNDRAGWLSVVEGDRRAAVNAGPLRVASADLRSDWVKRGHDTAVTAVVTNPLDRVVNHTVTVTVDGAVVARHAVELEPGERQRVVVPFDAVAGEVSVDGATAGELAVSDHLGGGREDEPVAPSRDGSFWIALVATTELVFVAAVVVTAGDPE